MGLALVLIFASVLGEDPRLACPCESPGLKAINRKLSGTLVDFTQNHGCDNRIPSAVLGMPRDLYVYLPPGYTSNRAYPLLVWLHGAFADENSFMADSVLFEIDRLMAAGSVPPMIVACPDGAYEGTRGFFTHHSFFINGRGGNYEDHVIHEVYPFVLSNFSVRPEREAHVLGGVSAGGFGAVMLAMKHRDQFHAVGTLAAPVNLRASNPKEKYFKNFKPEKFVWRENYNPKEVIGKFFGIIRLKAGRLLDHAFGPEEVLLSMVRENNPADLLFDLDLQPGELRIYLNYPSYDNFNFDAQTESFEWLAHQKGIQIETYKDKHARHLVPYFRRHMPDLLYWLGQRVPPPAEVEIVTQRPIHIQ